MNTLKLYWTQKRQESIATLTMLLTSSIVLLVPGIWYDPQLVVITAWFLISTGIIGHALCMVLVHRKQHKTNAKVLVSLMLSMAVIQAGAQTAPPTTPPPTTAPPFEFDVTLSTGIPGNQENPQAVIPAAVCIGIGVGLVGWIGIKLWSACLDIQLKGITNNVDEVNLNAAAEVVTSPPDIPSTSNPVTGSGCQCSPPPTVSPMPFLLEHTRDGQSWSPVSVGMTTGQRVFVPDIGTWRITPMKIIATRDSMIVPPGTLETSVDLRTWTTVSVSHSVHTVIPEPNHFYRIR